MTGVELGIDAKFWLDLSQWVITLAIGWYAWSTNRQRARQKDIESVRQVLGQLSIRVDHLESSIDHLPSKEDFHQIALGLQELHGDVGKIEAALGHFKEMGSVMRGQVEMINRFLMKEHG